MQSILKGISAGITSILIYLLIVVLTTPALSPYAAISAALRVNTIIITGMGIGMGIQVFLSTYAKSLGCSLSSHVGKGGSMMGSFFSFFALVPLGCCGTILYMLSLLPAIFGITISTVLIEYSKQLSYIGIALIFLFNLISYMRIRKVRLARHIR